MYDMATARIVYDPIHVLRDQSKSRQVIFRDPVVVHAQWVQRFDSSLSSFIIGAFSLGRCMCRC